MLLLIVVGSVLGALLATGLAAIGGADRWVLVGSTLLILIVLGWLVGRMFRRTWAPVGELIEATNSLGNGDTSVRLHSHRPGPLAAVYGSFNRMAEHLELEDDRRRRLLADIGHELRTPMTVIRGEIEAVLDGMHQPESLSNVVDEIDLMERLLEDLRVLALAEAGRLRLMTEPVDITEIVNDVLGSFARRAEAQSVDIVMDMTTPAVVVGDTHRLHQVVSNLVSNALDQMIDGGVLAVSVESGGKQVTIEVADTGPGIPENALETIFDRFHKAVDSAGTGLGLSISRDLVEAHGGTVTASNLPGRGASFVVRLPAQPSSRA